MQITKNPDKEKYQQAMRDLENNNWYRLGTNDHNIENHCPCTQFIEEPVLGVCYCGRYIKTEV